MWFQCSEYEGNTQKMIQLILHIVYFKTKVLQIQVVIKFITNNYVSSSDIILVFSIASKQTTDTILKHLCLIGCNCFLFLIITCLFSLKGHQFFLTKYMRFLTQNQTILP